MVDNLSIYSIYIHSFLDTYFEFHRGATHSNLVICNENGVVVGKSKGPGTNHWSVGIDECANRVLGMVHAAKEAAGIPKDKPLDSLVNF